MKFTLFPTDTMAQAEGMRRVRNSCREFMTGDQRELSHCDQRAWFKTLNRSAIKPFFGTCLDDRGNQLCAYGIVRLENDRWWLSGGLLPEYRGMGLGAELFQKLTAVAHFYQRDAWLKVLSSNRRAIRLYQSLGFELADTNNDPVILTMKKEWR